MTLCQNSKTKYFGRLFLAFVMLLGGVFFINTSASAEILTFNANNILKYYQLDNSCDDVFNSDNNLSLRDAGGDYAISWTSNIFNNGLKVLGEGSSNTSKSSGCYTSTSDLSNFSGTNEFTIIVNLYNPVQPASLLSMVYAGDGVSKEIYYIIESNGRVKFMVSDLNNMWTYIETATDAINFDQNNRSYQIAVSGTWGDIYLSDWKIFINGIQANNYNAATGGTLNNFDNSEPLKLMMGRNYDYAGSTEFAEVSFLNKKLIADDLQYLMTTSLYEEFSGGGGSSSNDYVMYYGNNPVYTAINTNYNLPVVYNVCDSWEDGKIILKLNNDNASSSEKLLTQCSGRFNFNSGAGSSEMSNTSYFTIENFRDHTVLATSNSFISTVYTPVFTNPSNVVFRFTNPYILKASSTAIIRYTYDQENISPYDYIEIFRYTSSISPFEGATTTVATSSIIEYPFKYNGNSFFTLEGTSTLLGTTYYGVVGHLASYWDSALGLTVPARETDEYGVVVDWTNTAFSLEDAKAYWASQADNDVLLSVGLDNNILNVSPRDLACSADEWAMANQGDNWWELNVFNWTKFRCDTLTRVFSVLKFSQNLITSVSDYFLNALSVFFPFNVISFAELSWLESGSGLALPSGLSYFDIIDGNGDISLSFPAEWGGTSTPFVIFGNTPINSVPALSSFFSAFRSASTYILYAAFLWGLYKFALIFRNRL